MGSYFFSSSVFLFETREGGEFYRLLCIAIPKRAEAEALFQAVWGHLARFPGDSFVSEKAWKNILNLAARERLLSKLCDEILKDEELKSLHASVRAIQSAAHPVQSSHLGSGRLFLDRTRLRSTLENMSNDRPVLVIRGQPGSGKSFTRELIKSSFDPPDLFVEVDVRVNYTFEDFISRLLMKIEPKERPAKAMTSASARHRDICFEMLRLAEGNARFQNRKLWVIVDDINDARRAPGGKRLSHCGPILSFMETFVVEMTDSHGFGKYFRLVLVDYPEKDLKWPDVWNEDRPDPDQIDAKLIGTFLVEHLGSMGKFVDPVVASKRADEIMSRAAPAAPHSRLRTIMDEVTSQLKMLGA